MRLVLSVCLVASLYHRDVHDSFLLEVATPGHSVARVWRGLRACRGRLLLAPSSSGFTCTHSAVFLP